MGVKGSSPLVEGSREGKALSIFLHLCILKSTALGLRGGVANPCDNRQSLPFYCPTPPEYFIHPLGILRHGNAAKGGGYGDGKGKVVNVDYQPPARGRTVTVKDYRFI